jgi:CspA family cold shock protein
MAFVILRLRNCPIEVVRQGSKKADKLCAAAMAFLKEEQAVYPLVALYESRGSEINFHFALMAPRPDELALRIRSWGYEVLDFRELPAGMYVKLNHKDLPVEARVLVQTEEGLVKWFSDTKGYGFIERPDEDGDLFVHFMEIEEDGYKSLQKGQRVEYTVMLGPKGLFASGVTKL